MYLLHNRSWLIWQPGIMVNMLHSGLALSHCWSHLSGVLGHGISQAPSLQVHAVQVKVKFRLK